MKIFKHQGHYGHKGKNKSFPLWNFVTFVVKN